MAEDSSSSSRGAHGVQKAGHCWPRVSEHIELNGVRAIKRGINMTSGSSLFQTLFPTILSKFIICCNPLTKKFSVRNVAFYEEKKDIFGLEFLLN